MTQREAPDGSLGDPMQPILKIDLTTRLVEKVIIPQDWERSYLGGASLAARMLFSQLTPDLDPFSPQAPLLFLNGPLTGTSGPAVGRFVICSRSPATRLWAESNCGGFWGPELRKAGYDGLWITGRSPEPVYLLIRDEQVGIFPADHLWGLDTYATQRAIEDEAAVGKLRVAVIGPAGERRIPFALILTDHGRVAGRTGLGAVMGAKNLKAVAVQGHGKVPVQDYVRYIALRSEVNRQLRNDSVTTVLHELGSASAAEYFDYLGEMPKRYFHRSVYPETIQISGASLNESILVGTSACHACVIACGRVVQLEDGEKRKGPEYETLVGFGPNVGLNDPVFATRMGELCDRYGMDSISMSNTIGLALTLFEKGIITPAHTSDLALNWGDAEVVETLVHLTARQESIGRYLAMGARALGKAFGAEHEAVQVNGLEVPYHDPRGASGMALVYATSPRGACHNQGDYFLADIGQVEESLGMQVYPRRAGAEKARNVARHQDWRTVFNSLVMCSFAGVPPESILDLVNAACGLEWNLEQLMKAGERGWNLKRVINNRLGLRREHDRLPEALLRPFPDQEDEAGYVPDLQGMLSAYYMARGWNPATGFPSPEKLLELDLDWVQEDLSSAESHRVLEVDLLKMRGVG